jgi:hypothetical protein
MLQRFIYNKKVIFLLTFFLILCFFSCKKDQLGGKSKVKGIVAHHGSSIEEATVYIKFNATEFPGEDVGVYDEHVRANSNGYYEISNFYKGNYYLYAVGIDSTIPAPYIVKGGIAVKLRSKEELDMDIAVTEE